MRDKKKGPTRADVSVLNKNDLLPRSMAGFPGLISNSQRENCALSIHALTQVSKWFT